MEELWTVAEAAAYFKVSTDTLWRWTREDLAFRDACSTLTPGGTRRWRRAACENWTVERTAVGDDHS